MPARKSPPERPRKASGANVEEWQRHTARVVLRLDPAVAAMLRASAEAREMTLSEYVSQLERDAQLATRILEAEEALDVPDRILAARGAGGRER
jgi:uncharacterized protein (DUF1778 family)